MRATYEATCNRLQHCITMLLKQLFAAAQFGNNCDVFIKNCLCLHPRHCHYLYLCRCLRLCLSPAPTTPHAPLPFIHIYPTLPVLVGRRPTFCSAIWKFKRFAQHEHMLNVDFSFAVPSKRSRPPTRPQPSAWQTTTQTATGTPTTTTATASTWPGTRRTSTTSVTGGETRKMAKRANQMKPFIVGKHFWGKRQMSKSKWSQNAEQQSGSMRERASEEV